MTNSVQFLEADSNGKPIHEYKVAGIKTPSVTYVLDKRGFCNYQDCPEDYMEAARERGDIGHEVTEVYDRANPYELVSVEMFQRNCPLEFHSWAIEQLELWLGFRDDFGFCPTLIEEPLAWKLNGMMVCGKPDCFGESKLGPMLVEKKFTAKIEASVKYQLAGYSSCPELWRRGKRPLRYAAHFKDGRCIPVPFTRSKDEIIFSAALAITHDLWNGGSK